MRYIIDTKELTKLMKTASPKIESILIQPIIEIETTDELTSVELTALNKLLPFKLKKSEWK